jgi:serine/threonine-protein kinase
MGIVWRAWLFHAPGTPEADLPPTAVALKVLSPRLHGRAELRALFVHEAEAMRSLWHPNVVRFHALVDRPGELAIAMEYVDGETLEDVVARQVARGRLAAKGFAGALPGLPFARAWNYFQQLLGALAGTHALGLVHRDVKPSNVLIRRDGVVKLGDFGIAQLARGKTDPGLAAAGTAAYMSPEQVTEGPVDPRSDLYAAATVLFEMLAGRTPFDVQARGEILVRRDQVEAQPPPLRTFVPQAPPVLDALFARALAKDPAQRFQTAIELGEAFRHALGLPESPEWHAQAELARSATMPIQIRAEPARAQRMATLRDFLVERYRTVKIEQR